MGQASDMPPLPRRSQELINATPLRRVRTGVRAVVELTAYPDGHANLAVGDLDLTVRATPPVTNGRTHYP